MCYPSIFILCVKLSLPIVIVFVFSVLYFRFILFRCEVVTFTFSCKFSPELPNTTISFVQHNSVTCIFSVFVAWFQLFLTFLITSFSIMLNNKGLSAHPRLCPFLHPNIFDFSCLTLTWLSVLESVLFIHFPLVFNVFDISFLFTWSKALIISMKHKCIFPICFYYFFYDLF